MMMTFRIAALALPFVLTACGTSSSYEPPLPTLPSPQHLPAPPVAAAVEMPDTLPELPKEDPVKATTAALSTGLVTPRREWYKGVTYSPPYHPNHGYLIYTPEGGSTSLQFGKREIPDGATCEGVVPDEMATEENPGIMSTAWKSFGEGASESWVLDIKVKIMAPRQRCTITTNRGVYIVVVQPTQKTHTMKVQWSDPYNLLAPDNGIQSAPICRGTDANYRLTGNLGAFGVTTGSISNDGAHTCIKFPPSAGFDLPAAWLIEGENERPASPATINGAYLIDGVPPVIELRTDNATLRIERLERIAP
jgi:hypothetical protein